MKKYEIIECERITYTNRLQRMFFDIQKEHTEMLKKAFTNRYEDDNTTYIYESNIYVT